MYEKENKTTGGRPKQNQAHQGRKNVVLTVTNTTKRIGTLLTFRDDFTTIINSKAWEVRKCGQIYRKRYLRDTIENIHMRFLEEDPTL